MFFGRRKGRKLSPSLEGVFNKGIFNWCFSLPEKGEISPSSLFSFLPKHLHIEIGFGQGEHLLMQAKANAEDGFIGCEPFVNGVAACLKEIEKEKISNIRIFNDDALKLFEKLPPASIDALYVLFPDPWPKKKHHKRRIISSENLKIFKEKLKQGATVLFATDHKAYFDVMLDVLQKEPHFQIKNIDHFSREPLLWTKTKYQHKTSKEGRPPQFIQAIRL